MFICRETILLQSILYSIWNNYNDAVDDDDDWWKTTSGSAQFDGGNSKFARHSFYFSFHFHFGRQNRSRAEKNWENPNNTINCKQKQKLILDWVWKNWQLKHLSHYTIDVKFVYSKAKKTHHKVKKKNTNGKHKGKHEPNECSSTASKILSRLVLEPQCRLLRFKFWEHFR